MDPAHRRRDHRRGDRRLVGRHPHEVGAVHRPLMGIEKLLGDVQNLVVQLTAIANVLFPFAHPNLVVKALLNDSIGLLLKVWFGLILHTTDFETGREFTANSTIQVFEPKVQLVANAALTLVAIWASYRVMWGHGLRSQFTAPLAGLLFTLPETHHLAKQWSSLFMTNLLMQPIQLFVLAIGFALERGGYSSVHHLFALAALLVVFKVPGAMGSSEKVAHKLESALKQGFHAVEHAVARA